MKRMAIAAAALAAFTLTACEQQGYGTKQTVGALGGAAAGGLVGSQIGSGSGKLAATAIGVLAGGLIGSEIGKSLDSADRLEQQQAAQRAQTAAVGQTIAWNNPQSGNSGTVTPVRDGTSADGQYCREFEQSVTVDGRTERATGVACRQPDGSWKVVS